MSELHITDPRERKVTKANESHLCGANVTFGILLIIRK